MRMKTVLEVTSAPGRHWVGNGFPVHGMFGYSGRGVAERSPFLMLDYAAPTRFEPTTERRGFLPIATTRGDRLFIGLLSAAWLNLAFVAVSEKMIEWFSLESEPSIWFSFVASMALLALVMRKG